MTYEALLCHQSLVFEAGIMTADSDDSDQTLKMPNLIVVFAKSTRQLIDFGMSSVHIVP